MEAVTGSVAIKNAPNIIAPLTSWLIALKCVKPVKAVAVAKQKKGYDHCHWNLPVNDAF